MRSIARRHDALAAVADRREPGGLVAQLHDAPAVDVAGGVGVGRAHPAHEDGA